SFILESPAQIALIVNILMTLISGFGFVAACVTLINFAGPIVEVYFAKIIVDYAEIVKIQRENALTPRRVEASNITSSQVIN
ncbi:16720_t:CDS:2, partial [Dentiscutata erythropus]